MWSIRWCSFFNSQAIIYSCYHKKLMLRIMRRTANLRDYFYQFMYFRKVMKSLYFAIYCRPTSWELRLTKMLAITHRLAGFVSMNEKSIYNNTEESSVGPFYLSSLYVNSYCFDTLSRKSRPSSSTNPSAFLKSIIIGWTQSTSLSAQASLLLKCINVDRHNLWIC